MQQRPSGLYFRRTIPLSLRSFLKQSELIFSLRTHDRKAAFVRAAAVLRLSDFYFERVSAMNHESVSVAFKADVKACLDRFVKSSFHSSENELYNGTGASPATLSEVLQALDKHLTHPASLQPAKEGLLAELTDMLLSSLPSIPQDNPVATRAFVQREALRKLRELVSSLLELQTNPGFIAPTSQPLQVMLPSKGAPEEVGPELLAAWREYVQEKGQTWKGPTASQYEAIIAEFSSNEFAGNRPINTYSRDDLITYRGTLQRLPVMRKKLKQFRDKSVAELCNMEIPADLHMQGRTINERLIQLCSFFTWCHKIKGYLSKDITEDVLLKNVVSAERAPFTDPEISTLFSPDRYLSELINSPFKYWLPLLGLYCGARIGELSQLKPDDFGVEDGIAVMYIRHDTKSEAGRRVVPLHSALITLGLLDYVQWAQAQGHSSLFPDLNVGAQRYGTAASKWFTQYRRKVGISDTDKLGKEKVFHSFRHSFVTRLRQLPTNRPDIGVIQQIVGHEQELFGATAIYTHDFPIGLCKEAVAQLRYPVDVPALQGRWKQLLAKVN